MERFSALPACELPGRVGQLDFKRDISPATFAGNNGTLTEITALWNSLVVDPSDPSYTAAIGNLFGIDHVSSFGQDNAGNLYIVDFGHGTGFQGQYPAAGLGEIFRITPLPPGDADLDGDVDVQDFFAIDRGRALRLTGWASGDFTGNGVIDAQDYVIIDRAFLSQQSALAAPVALVPEPAALTLLGMTFAASSRAPDLTAPVHSRGGRHLVGSTRDLLPATRRLVGFLLLRIRFDSTKDQRAGS